MPAYHFVSALWVECSLPVVGNINFVLWSYVDVLVSGTRLWRLSTNTLRLKGLFGKSPEKNMKGFELCNYIHTPFNVQTIHKDNGSRMRT